MAVVDDIVTNFGNVLRLLVDAEEETVESENDDNNTAAGFIHFAMIILTVVAFVGNGAFLVYVFWMSK